MPTRPEIPLHVYEALEEEFISLHGSIPADEVVDIELPGDKGGDFRLVKSKRDWDFLEGHVKSPVNFAADVLEAVPEEVSTIVADSRAPQPYDWAKRNLKGYLRGKLDAEWLKELAESPADSPPERSLVEELERRLNKVLTEPDLYDGSRFSENWLSDASNGLVALHQSKAFEGDDLRHLNRLLLEDAFPDFIEPLNNIRLAAIHQRLHGVKPTALSLSGGGIRSGTFALGLLQGFARHKLLRRFDYLSTVSGGGYIGSWLSAWLHRHPEGLAGVTRDLGTQSTPSKIDPDPKPIQYLRNYSNFLTPKAGLLTADTWSFVGIYFRNLLLNWMVFIPLLLAVLMLPRLMVAFTLSQPVVEPPRTLRAVEQEKRAQVQGMQAQVEALEKATPRDEKELATKKKELKDASEEFGKLEDELKPGKMLERIPEERWLIYKASQWELRGIGRFSPRYLLLAVGLLLGVWALGFVGFNRPGVRETLRRSSPTWRDRTDQQSFLTYCLLPLVISATCLTTYWAWSREDSDKPWYNYLIFGLAFTFGGWLITSYVLGRLKGLRDIRWMELVLILAVGAVGGLVFWLFTYQQLLGYPVMSYGVMERGGEIKQVPIEWTNWGAWRDAWFVTELYVCIGVPLFLLTFWLAVTLFVGLSSNPGLKKLRIEDEDREWWARLGAWLLIASIGWAAFNAVVIFGPLLLLNSPKLLTSVGGLSGLIAVLVARSGKTPARGKQPADADTKSGKAAGLLGSLLPLLAVVFLALLLAGLSLATTGITRGLAFLAKRVPDSVRFDKEVLTNVPAQPAGGTWRGFEQYLEFIEPVHTALPSPSPTPSPSRSTTPAPDAAAPAPTPCQTLVCVPRGEEAKALASEAAAAGADGKPDAFTGAKLVHMNVLHHTRLRFLIPLALALAGFGLLMSWLIDLNKFSIHGGYRNRLIRAFLGASRAPGERKPNPFTGFDPADNLHMHELRWALFTEGDFIKPPLLAKELENKSNPVSAYLSERGLTDKIKAVKDERDAPALVAALRTELNAVLEGEPLYRQSFAAQYLRSPRAERLRDEIRAAINEATRGSAGYVSLENVQLRSDYHLLLNRLVLEEAFPKLLKLGQPPPYKLMHVVNTTLNLVGGNNLAWQQRKAEPFSVSPLHSGCFRVGYRDSRVYGGSDGVSIGTAAAVSGAAASSNMGYYTTSPVLSLLLTFFNVRLGWWLGNPGTAGGDTYYLSAPRLSVKPVVSEAFGLTDDRSPYVYLTDGGHFENLAIYEMVLRRCHVIVVSDAAADGEYRFGDLGNAVRKIRIDLGVPIEFPCVPIYSKEAADERVKDGKPGGSYWAVAKIRYSCVDRVRRRDGKSEQAPDGVLIYIKPAVYGGEPRDVVEYKENNPAFPHQSTGDQFFDEPQFESYRGLGSFIADQLCGSDDAELSLIKVVEMAGDKLKGVCLNEFKDAQTGQSFEQWLKDWINPPN